MVWNGNMGIYWSHKHIQGKNALQTTKRNSKSRFQNFVPKKPASKSFKSIQAAAWLSPLRNALQSKMLLFLLSRKIHRPEIFSMHGTSAQIGNGTLGNSWRTWAICLVETMQLLLCVLQKTSVIYWFDQLESFKLDLQSLFVSSCRDLDSILLTNPFNVYRFLYNLHLGYIAGLAVETSSSA